MKIVYLSEGDIHTAKWVNSLSALGYEVHLIVMEPVREAFPKDVKIYILPFGRPFGAVLNIFSIRSLLKRIKPDIFHVHSASVNGLLGRLSGFHPSILSVLGSDVLIIPHKSLIHKKIIIKNLEYYDLICSTSKAMAKSILDLNRSLKNLTVTSFGVDTKIFFPKNANRKNDNIIIGTVKAVGHIYGTDILIKAFSKIRQMLRKTQPELVDKMRLLIVGQGNNNKKIRSLILKLGLQDYVEMTGWVTNDQVPVFLRKLDVFVAMSRSESFGVAVLEASACGIPVVVSDVGGLPEVVEDGETGYIVQRENIERCADVIQKLVEDPALRYKMGLAGVKFVKNKYEWSICVKKMTEVYESFKKD